VDKGNPVRFIDAFVDSLNLEKLSFTHAIPNDTGRPPYNPADLLKLYSYGYLNQTRSSRKLERECHRNVEVMWLMKKLTPDFKTIADFRKDNVDRIKAVFKEFVYLCRSLNLYGAQLVAIDGCKFKAVNSRNRNFNEETLAERLKRTDEKINGYLKMLDENDRVDDVSCKDEKAEGLKEKLGNLEEKKLQYERIQSQMRETGQTEVSLTDPDSRLMRVNSQQLDVCYNVQSIVDAKNHLIVNYDVTNSQTDHHQLAKEAEEAKQTLCVNALDITSDKGFYVEKDVKDCEDNGVTVWMPIPSLNKAAGVPEPEFSVDKFVYNAARDVYACPRGKELEFWKLSRRGKERMRGKLYRTASCGNCLFRDKCTKNRQGRVLFRSEFQDAVDRLRARLESLDGKKKMSIRRELAEHPFGTMKRAFNQGYLLLKGLRKVKGEVGFTMLAYNMRRAINVLGVSALLGAIKAFGSPEGYVR